MNDAGFSVIAKLTGKDLTARQLKLCARNLPFELNLAMRRTLARVEKFMVLAAPHETGQFRRSIHSAMITGFSGEVGTNHEAGGALNEGAKPHIIKPRSTRALAIPQKDDKGKYTSLTRTRSVRGKERAGKFRKIQYRDNSKAPNKRHLDVLFYFTKRVNHPGMKGFWYLRRTEIYAKPVITQEANRAIDRAIVRAGGR